MGVPWPGDFIPERCKRVLEKLGFFVDVELPHPGEKTTTPLWIGRIRNKELSTYVAQTPIIHLLLFNHCQFLRDKINTQLFVSQKRFH